jgi:hypothetical protein
MFCLGTFFVPRDVLSLGMFYPWDVWSLRMFFPGRFVPKDGFSRDPWDVVARQDVLSLVGMFSPWDICLSGFFVPGISYTVSSQLMNHTANNTTYVVSKELQKQTIRELCVLENGSVANTFYKRDTPVLDL